MNYSKYLEDLITKIIELQGKETTLVTSLQDYKQKHIVNNIYYMSPERLEKELLTCNIIYGKIIYKWIEANDGHNSEFAKNLTQWISEYKIKPNTP